MPNLSSPIVVTGANGWVGRHVCRQLEGLSYPVRKVVRVARGPGEHPHVFGGGLDAGSPLENALIGCQTVIHCAAHVHHPNETPEHIELFRRVNVGGMIELLTASARSGISKIVFVSSSAVYDWRVDEPKAETSRLGPRSQYAISKLQAEQKLLESGMPAVLARLSTVYGAGDQANFAKLARAIKSGKFFIPGNGSAAKSVISIHRAAELLVDLALKDYQGCRVINLANPRPFTLSEICDSFSAVLNRKRVPRISLPLIRIGARLGDQLQKITPVFPLNTDILQKLTTSTVLDVQLQSKMFPSLVWPEFQPDLLTYAEYYATMA
jgi:nucleoside-diphosphate-sugar epimerase